MSIFSIIVPCYNVSQFIDVTINSVINQSCKDFELILINDGSTDDTLEKLITYESKFENIHVYSKSNGGVSSARNYGLEKSIGKYILFLDGDDYIDQTLLEDALFYLKQGEFDVFAFNFRRIREKNDRVSKDSIINSQQKINNVNFIEQILLRNIKVSICSMIYKREIIFENNFMFDEKTHNTEDVEFYFKVLKESKEILYTTRSYLNYVIREGSLVNSLVSFDNLDVVDRIIAILTGINDDYVKYFFARAFIYWFKSIFINKGTNQSIKALIQKDYLIKNFNIFNKITDWKNHIIVSVFKILYNPFLKIIIKKRSVGGGTVECGSY